MTNWSTNRRLPPTKSRGASSEGSLPGERHPGLCHKPGTQPPGDGDGASAGFQTEHQLARFSGAMSFVFLLFCVWWEGGGTTEVVGLFSAESWSTVQTGRPHFDAKPLGYL